MVGCMVWSLGVGCSWRDRCPLLQVYYSWPILWNVTSKTDKAPLPEKQVNVCVRIPGELARAFRIKLASRREKATTVIIDAIQTYLRRRK